MQAQACFLAPSLKRHLDPSVHKIAYFREDAAPITAETRRVLEACDVETRAIPGTLPGDENPWRAPYPEGNKLLAARDMRSDGVKVFLDTDVILVRPVDFDRVLGDAAAAATISDYSTLNADEEGWRAFYGLFGLDLPQERLRLLKGRRFETAPYFNAGVVLWRDRPGDARFGAAWADNAIRFDHEATTAFNRVNIDQLTLPITGYQLNRPVAPLDIRYNFNLAGRNDDPAQENVVLHYHKFGVLWRYAPAGKAVLEMLRDAVGDEAASAALSAHRDVLQWQKLKRIL